MKVKTSDLIITQFNEFKMLLVNKNEIRLLDLKKKHAMHMKVII